MAGDASDPAPALNLSSRDPNRRSPSGRSAALPRRTEVGATGSATASRPARLQASNRIGAALRRPVIPGDGVPSGRPAHTANTKRPSKPTAQLSRKPKEVPVL